MWKKYLCIIGFCLSAAPAVQAEWYTGTAAILEDTVQIEFWHDNPDYADRCISGVQDEMRRIDVMISADNPKSEMAKINRKAARRPVTVSTELYGLIEKALRFGAVTRGAFDITFASVGFLYDYEKRVRPDSKKTKKALQVVDYRLVQTNRRERTVHFLKDGMRIDISGIGKGHAVDRAIKTLAACGAMHALVSAGGDTRAMSDRRGKPWVVEIRNPRAGDQVYQVRIPLNDQAISTSGDYERAFEQDGVRYHQIINPRTGNSPSDVRSVSVVGPDGIWCDALATGIFVLGITEGMEVIESLDGYEAYLVDHNGGHHRTSGLQTHCDHVAHPAHN
ncbi:MAG: FAD:protein FMN transferase [Gammaproteobacteria bacterium]|nr:FAD:protein FMN transferase [Gammaproteobacteria bacterium]NNF61235.1 FAD:protein FMN transferase [Gammaproteobacteria bacterium]NNM20789.1 FAD:protein FMN transferase [Gammaproteobacteria bacterium]